MTTEEWIEQMLALWEELGPDPVDLFEDELAAFSLVRYPDLDLDAWRVLRVRFI